MKRLAVVLALAVVLGLGAYFLSYYVAQCTFCRVPDVQEPTGWMRQEFHLNDAQYAQVAKLESDYYPHCAEMCDQIEQSHMALKKLILANTGMTPEVQAALQKDSAVQQECREAMLKHFYAVSQAMSPEQGKRYLEMMAAQVVETENSSKPAAVPH